MALSGGDKTFLIVAAIGLVVAGVLWAASKGGEATEKRERLAVRLAEMDGNQTCNMAWLKAVDLGIDDGRTPSIYAPETRLIGPPLILSCPMIRSDLKDAEPLLIIKRCDQIDLDCIDFARP